MSVYRVARTYSQNLRLLSVRSTLGIHITANSDETLPQACHIYLFALGINVVDSTSHPALNSQIHSLVLR